MGHTLFRRILLASMLVATAAMAGEDDSSRTSSETSSRRELASTGRLRVGVVSAPKANVFFIVTDASGRPHGVTVDLGDELARTLEVETEYFVAHNSGEVTDALENGLIDVAFLPVDDE